MPNFKLINFTDLNQEQSNMVLKWRNDEKVAKFMKTREISKQDHAKFLQNLKSDETKRYFLVRADEEYIGVIDFVDIRQNSCEFGLYANPNLKGQGQILMPIITNYASKTLNVRELRACAFNQNEKAIALYQKFGFKIYNKDEQMSYMSLNLNANLI